MKTRAQTATEYLIILAVVIIIAFLVVSVLGGIPALGGGASEQTVRLQLASQDVGVSNYVVSEAKGLFTFRNNQAFPIQINNVTVDGKDCWLIGSNAQPNKQPRLRPGASETISCGSITAQNNDPYTYSLAITYTDTKTNAQYTIDDLEIKGTAPNFACPDGFIPVPGGFVLADGSTVDDFCVAKYEMKDVGGVATSQAAGTPWVSIDWYDSVSNCTDLGSGYDLISDQQWMVLAENILNTNINDLNGSASGPQLATGHSDNSPSGAQVSLATEDPVVTGCDLNQPADASANAYVEGSCEIQGSGVGSKGYYNTGDAFSGTYNPSSSGGRDEMRTHVLSNGEVVWDLAGNVYQWTNTPLIGLADSFYSGGDYDDGVDYSGVSWMQPSFTGNRSSHGLGYYYVEEWGQSPYPVALRGGFWNAGVYAVAGVFSVDDYSEPSFANTDLGFRCVYEPN